MMSVSEKATIAVNKKWGNDKIQKFKAWDTRKSSRWEAEEKIDGDTHLFCVDQTNQTWDKEKFAVGRCETM